MISSHKGWHHLGLAVVLHPTSELPPCIVCFQPAEPLHPSAVGSSVYSPPAGFPSSVCWPEASSHPRSQLHPSHQLLLLQTAGTWPWIPSRQFSLKLHDLALNLHFLCFNLPTSWDGRPVLPTRTAKALVWTFTSFHPCIQMDGLSLGLKHLSSSFETFSSSQCNKVLYHKIPA